MTNATIAVLYSAPVLMAYLVMTLVTPSMIVRLSAAAFAALISLAIIFFPAMASLANEIANTSPLPIFYILEGALLAGAAAAITSVIFVLAAALSVPSIDTTYLGRKLALIFITAFAIAFALMAEGRSEAVACIDRGGSFGDCTSTRF